MWTILSSMTVDTIIQLTVMVVTVTGFFFGMRNEVRFLRKDISHIQERLNQLTESFSQMGTILTTVAVQDTRINMLERQLHELKHGQGFVVEEKINR